MWVLRCGMCVDCDNYAALISTRAGKKAVESDAMAADWDDKQKCAVTLQKVRGVSLRLCIQLFSAMILSVVIHSIHLILIYLNLLVFNSCT